MVPRRTKRSSRFRRHHPNELIFQQDPVSLDQGHPEAEVALDLSRLLPEKFEHGGAIEPGADKRPKDSGQPATLGAEIAAGLAIVTTELMGRRRQVEGMDEQKVLEIEGHPGFSATDGPAVRTNPSREFIKISKERIEVVPGLAGQLTDPFPSGIISDKKVSQGVLGLLPLLVVGPEEFRDFDFPRRRETWSPVR